MQKLYIHGHREPLGANPPKNPEPLFKMREAMPSPPEYLIHTEWDAVEVTRLCFAKVLVNHRMRKINDDVVMSLLMRGPYLVFFQPIMNMDYNFDERLSR